MAWTRPVMAPAFAKVNLTLEVLGRRPDGYHELASVMQTISLQDTIVFRPAPDGVRSLTCDQPAIAGDQNLALRAAHALARATGCDAGAAIELRKEIPIQGGLGGGSSDAACVLLALARLWGQELTTDRLASLAAELGSDVPFFLAGGAALVTGRGEHVAPLPDPHPLQIVLVRPPISIPTAAAFAALTPADFADGSASTALAAALGGGGLVPLDRLVNSFERSVLRDYPLVARTWEAIVAAGAPIVRLSGSGPTLFAPFEALAPAMEVWRRLQSEGREVWLAHTVSRAEVVHSLPAIPTDAR
jgi:4-diphosphocytidyl-2-C-methyl-D-erythritol kinase